MSPDHSPRAHSCYHSFNNSHSLHLAIIAFVPCDCYLVNPALASPASCRVLLCTSGRASRWSCLSSFSDGHSTTVVQQQLFSDSCSLELVHSASPYDFPLVILILASHFASYRVMLRSSGKIGHHLCIPSFNDSCSVMVVQRQSFITAHS